MTKVQSEIKQLDIIKLRKMRMNIYMLEKQNYLTGKFTHAEMKNRIRQIIIDEYKKNIGG